MKILFLDFDGVLNSWAYFKSRDPDADAGAGVAWALAQLDPVAVKRIDTVVEKTDCYIVISSTWRLGDTLSALRDFLGAKGLRSGRVVGKTPNGFLEPELRGFGEKLYRAHEIAHYLHERREAGRDVTRFAIVDDDVDAGIGYAPQFVQTDIAVGITDADVEKLVAILNREEEP
jgi:hypothetical protein